MYEKFRKQLLIVLALAIALITVPAHADKWATAILHTKQPIDQVFRQTAILADGTKWGFRTTSRIESTNVQEGTIQADLMSGGAKWGCMYISIRAEGTGTSVEAVVSLLSEAWHNPGTFADRFGKALHKRFPDLKYEVKRDTIPDDFAFGISQVSLPLSPPIVSPAHPAQNSVTQLNSIQYSLQQIANNLSQQADTPTAPVVNVGTPAVVVVPTQNYTLNEQQQAGQAAQALGTTLMAIGAGMEARVAVEVQRVNQATTSHAVRRFLSDANLVMNRFMITTESEERTQFKSTAQAVNKARDDTYATLTNAFQRAMFNQITNDYMITFKKQMADHASHPSTDPNILEEQHAKNLHQALDSWYANGKEWNKIPPEVWNKLTERDKGRLKDGIDPEIVGR